MTGLRVLLALGAMTCGHPPPPPPVPPPPAPPDYVELPENNGETGNCVALVVGPAREPAQLCDQIHVSYWHTTRQTVTVTRGGRRVTVLDLLTKIEGCDTGAKELELRLRIAADGMSAITLDGEPSKISDQPGPFETCSTPSTRESSPIETMGGSPSYAALRRELCRGRTAYRWQAGRFVRSRR